jgi:hypothetical protein
MFPFPAPVELFLDFGAIQQKRFVLLLHPCLHGICLVADVDV